MTPEQRARKNQRTRERRRTTLRREKLKERYGLTPEDYAAMAMSQDHACAICADDSPLVVDHDHESGKVRALLCHACNRGLGHFRDSPARLRNAAEYLERHA